MLRRIAVLPLPAGSLRRWPGKSIQSQEGTKRCLTKPDRKAVVSSCETRDGAPWTLFHALDPAKENIYALESLNRYTVSGSGES
jgi:hypothetical protein